MTREEEKEHQSHLYTKVRCDLVEIPDWEEVEFGFQAGMEYADEHPIHYDGQAMLYVLQKGVKQGKKQALEEFEKNRLEHCDNITEEQYNLESNFVNSHLEKYHRIPTILDAIEYGLEKGKKEILDRVIEWLDNDLCCYIGAQNFTIEHNRLNKDLRKAMEEQP